MREHRAAWIHRTLLCGAGVFACVALSGRAQEVSPDVSPADGGSLQALQAELAEAIARGHSDEAEDLARQALREARAAAAAAAATTTVTPAAIELELAIILVERAIELEATSDLGLSLRRGVLEQALEHFSRAADAPLHFADGVIGVASCQVRLEREVEAEATLRDALAALPVGAVRRSDRLRLVSELVRFLTLRTRVDEARAEIESAAARGEFGVAERALETLRIAALRGEAASAPALAEAAAEAGADGFEVAFLAWEALGSGAFEAKLALYSRLHEKVPDAIDYLYYRGATRLAMGAGRDAIGDLERCVDAPVFGDRARANLGKALLQAGRSDEALACFTVVLEKRGELTKDALEGLVGVAVARARGRRYADALVLYEQVLARDPQNVWAHIGVPLCHRSLGDLDAAARSYEAGLAALPDEAQLMNDYGLLLHARGDRATARRQFERALGSGSADGGENLGIFALRDDRDPRTAADWFARTLALDPTRARVRFYRELCLTELGASR